MIRSTNRNDEGETALNTPNLSDLQAQIRKLEDELHAAKAAARLVKTSTAKAKRQPRECGCGCGDWTSGGTFVPGHDAKLRSRLLKTIREGTDEEGQEALAALQRYPNLAHGIGPWDLGRTRKDKEDKAARKAEAARAKERRTTADQNARDARDRMVAKSRAEQLEAANKEIARKEKALAEARAAGPVIAGQK